MKIGLIGAGFIANAHIIAAQKLGSTCEISGVYSTNFEKCTQFCNKYGLKPCESLESLLQIQGLEGVIIATPPQSHFEIIRKCLNSGIKNLLIEKPLATCEKEVRKIAKLAEKQDAYIQEAFAYRHDIGALEFIKYAKSLGKIDMIDANFHMPASQSDESWRNSPDKFGGVAYDFLCYPLDICSEIADSRPHQIYATYDLDNGLCQRIAAQIRFENGVISQISASRFSGFIQKISIYAPYKTLDIDVAFANIGAYQMREISSDDFVNYSVKEKNLRTAPKPPDFFQQEAFVNQLKYFCANFNQGYKSKELEKNLTNTILIEAVLKSCKTQKPLKIKTKRLKL